MNEEIDKKVNTESVEVLDQDTQNTKDILENNHIRRFETGTENKEFSGENSESVGNKNFPEQSNNDGGINDNTEIKSQESFDPKLAYTTAVMEHKQDSIESHVVENVDYTQPNGAARKVLQDLIGGETTETI